MARKLPDARTLSASEARTTMVLKIDPIRADRIEDITFVLREIAEQIEKYPNEEHVSMGIPSPGVGYVYAGFDLERE